MIFYVVLFLLFVTSMLKLLSKFCVLEATDRSGAALILGGGDVGFFDVVATTLHGGIKARLSRGVDTNTSVSSTAHRLSSNAFHPPLAQDWGETRRAAISSTVEVIQHFKHSTGPDEIVHLYPFIQSVTLLTFMRLFLPPPIVPTNAQEAVQIIGKSWKTGGRHQDFIEDPAELCRLVDPSPNRPGMLILLSATQRLILSAVCLLERQNDIIHFVRQAKDLLQHPASSGSEVSRLVEKTLQSHPPIQSVHGRLSFGRLSLCQTHEVNFSIPVDTLPLSTCIMGPDESCASCHHKATLPGPPECSGREWLVHATAIILSAIETEIREARLTVDSGDRHDPEAWEGWVLRRLRV